MSVKLVTLFSCPKPFTGHDALIQHNALANWKALGVDIILLGNDLRVNETAEQYECVHISDIARTEYGTPLLSDIFAKAQSAARTPLVCYTNADILYPPAFIEAAKRAVRRFPKRFLMVGQRWDADVFESLDFSGDWGKMLETIRSSRAVLHNAWGMDYFLFPTGMITMPDFAIGRPAWDNWTLWDTRIRGIPLIDATDALPILHQNHNYNHVPGRVTETWAESPEALSNKELARSLGLWEKREIKKDITLAPWRMTQSHRILPNRICYTLAISRTIHAVHLVPCIKSFIRRCVGSSIYEKIKRMYHNLRGRNPKNSA